MKLKDALSMNEKFEVEIDPKGNPQGEVDGEKIANLGDFKAADQQKQNKAFLMATMRYLQKNQGFDEKAIKKPGGGWQNIISRSAEPADIQWDGTLNGKVIINWEIFISGSQSGKKMNPISIKASDLIKYMKPDEKKLFQK